MVEVEFTPLHPWVLPPDKPRVDRAAARAERDAYRDSFRHLRVPRLPADCPPWVLGRELGWSVRSPLTLTMTPLDDVGLAVPPGEDPHRVGRRLGGHAMWRRGEDWLATGPAPWLHLGDHRTAEGWEAMFVPNGQGTVEWHLGWAARLPPGTFLLVMPPPDGPPDGLDVPVGVLPAKAVHAMAERGGTSIAVHPRRPVTVRRGQEVARIVLLHADTLRAAGRTAPGPTAPPERAPAGTDRPGPAPAHTTGPTP
ncbi:hypothetical protein ACN20G_30595 (plasmid) [Streptomyces sp. BI20]|uniref:hypothetical protein n=1 Tax=Streptomyces sp. BI20 TaxID=3403460 RepID=UPI003C771141